MVIPSHWAEVYRARVGAIYGFTEAMGIRALPIAPTAFRLA